MNRYLVVVAILFLVGGGVAATAAVKKHVVTGMWAPQATATSSARVLMSTSTSATELDAPTLVHVANYSTQRNTLVIVWLPVFEARGYSVTRTGGDSSATPFYTRSPEWTDQLPWGLVASTTFQYTITALDEGGNPAATSTSFSYTLSRTPVLRP